MSFGPVFNASSIPLNLTLGTMPEVSGAMLDYFQPISIKLIQKSVVDFKNKETATLVGFYGVWLPFTDQQLYLKPEGQRAWKWAQLFCYPAVVLTPDDLVVYQAIQYRVITKGNYGSYGYIYYHLVEDYTGSDPT